MSISPSSQTINRTNGEGGTHSVKQASWSASISGGSGNYSRSWSGGGSPAGSTTGAGYTSQYDLSDNETASFSVGLSVFDNNTGQTGSGSASVTYRSQPSGAPNITDIITSPASATGSRNTPGIAISTTVSCTPVGGTAPFSWSWTPSNGGGITCNSPNSSATNFSGTVNQANAGLSNSFTVTCTDANGKTFSKTVGCTLYYTGPDA